MIYKAKKNICFKNNFYKHYFLELHYINNYLNQKLFFINYIFLFMIIIKKKLINIIFKHYIFI